MLKNSLLVKENTFKSMNEIIGINKSVYFIAGPCSVESKEQIETIAETLAKNDVHILRGGTFKPRTSPYDFQGYGEKALKMLKDAGKKHSIMIISEVMDSEDIDVFCEYADILQVGSRNMTNFSLLKKLGKLDMPILLKRGMMSTYNEFLLAAEYLALEGNNKIIMCERGIRTFETNTRNTLDIAAVACLKSETSLPVIVDISHSLGRKDIVLPITKASIMAGANGIMLEVHLDPVNAKSDNMQQLNFDEFQIYIDEIKKFIKYMEMMNN